MKQGSLITAVLSALIALLALPALAHAVSPDKEILIYGEDTQELTTFKKLDCKVLKKGGKFLAKGKSSNGWRIEIHANKFDGFGKEYEIAYGIRETNFAIYPTAASSPYYANFFFPGDTPPPFGGALALSRSGKDLGIGFISAFSSSSDTDAVGMAGHAKCKYPKKKR